jgi:hypothetical protein
MSAVLLRHGGTVEKFIGDAIVAVFGVPVLHEDDALRAVRAAAEMRERLVTVKPVGMQTSSVAPGSVSPLQLVATFHAPVAGPSHVFVQGETAAGAIALRAPSGAWKPKAAATAPADPLVLGVEPELAANASAATVTSTAILETLDPPQIVVRGDFRAADPSLSGWLRRGATASGTSPVLQLRQEKSTEASAV